MFMYNQEELIEAEQRIQSKRSKVEELIVQVSVHYDTLARLLKLRSNTPLDPLL